MLIYLYLQQNHIAVGRFLRTLGEHSKVYIPHNTIRKAFYHFSALRSYTYNYFCYRCGHHPPILIADTNWKVAFDLPGRNSVYPFMKKILYPQKLATTVSTVCS